MKTTKKENKKKREKKKEKRKNAAKCAEEYQHSGLCLRCVGGCIDRMANPEIYSRKRKRVDNRK